MMKITFISRYGSKNLGDELIVRELEELLLRFTNDLDRYSFNLVHYSSLEASFKYNHKNSVSLQNKTRKKGFYKKYLREFYFVAILRNYLNKKRARSNINISQYKEKLVNADALIIGGGNAIFDTEKYSSSYYYFDLIINEARKLNIPIFVLNVGIGPFQTKRQHKKAIETLAKADYITVRDEHSYKLLESINQKEKKLYKTVDPVLFLKNDAKKIVTNGFHVGITVMDIRLANYTETQYINYIKNIKFLITYLLENTDYKITVFCTELKDSIATIDLEYMLNKFDKNKLTIHNDNDLNSILTIYKNIDTLFGTRMHSVIIAFSKGIPFIGLNWQQKVDGFFKVVNYQENLYEFNDFINSFNIIVDKLEKIKTNYSIERELIFKKKEELQPLYELNKVLLEEMLMNVD
ncbi:polysaccharide pyruvyl transferase family protein [Gracilibacillus dipsosauri]|uniref:Polysaccharide pyruvyl transferase domain-containing protein n=1 Tax=Gracilibacillus dipsosauri TaxID=178340 RepID=A0A317KV04_9BACI|nr:polysaccharide pyruvyl transferase family protein [Gracilibacillus dipsosauri]PWU67176.1 hypothetical protein DLJ74_16505 [Gracilibacillus dipsosauri]